MQFCHVFCDVWRGFVCILHIAHQNDSVSVIVVSDSLRYFLWQTMRGGDAMRMVVVRSPKIFSGLLRCIFGIKKEHINT